MRILFWASTSFIFWTYLGYPAYLWVRAHFCPRPVGKQPIEPFISILIAAHNEEANIARKLQNLAALDYPTSKVQLVVALDGCTDRTRSVLENSRGLPVTIVECPEHLGKAVALNAGLAECTGDIVAFTDVRQQIEPAALRSLLSNFADPEVGCTSGELMIGDSATGTTGYGLYWRLEKSIRRMESETGSVIGATGAFYAVRRDLIVPMPEGLILDDVFVPMHVIKAGKRVVFENEARAWDVPASDARIEFSRKVRTLAGNYQLIQIAPWLLGNTNPLRFEYLSHKLLRLLAPVALITLFVASTLSTAIPYRAALAVQVAFYFFALLGFAKLRIAPLTRITDPAAAFVVLNAASLVAAVEFVFRRGQLANLWRPAVQSSTVQTAQKARAAAAGDFR